MSPDEGARPAPELQNEQHRIAPGPPIAKEQTSRWPGWIWSVPIAAIAIVAWLAFKQIAATGPAIIVTFTNGAGMNPGNTEVHYNGIKVGEVESVRLAKDLKHVDVHLTMNSDMDGHLGPGTQFWMSSPPSISDLASLRTVISGPTIEMSPHSGKTQHHFVGLQQPPVLPPQEPGRNFVLTAQEKGSLSRGAEVYYKGQKVGAVTWIGLQPDDSFKFGIFIKAPYDALVHDGTRFWNASAAQFVMQPTGPSVQLQSPAALLQGAVAFETPPSPAEGPPASVNHQFELYDSKDAAEYAPGPDAVVYTATFSASGGGLANYAAVEFDGKRIGTVQTSRLVFNPDTGNVEEQVTLDLEPSRIPLPSGVSWKHPREQMNTLLNKLIAHGLRAQLGSQIPLVGPQNVQLAFLGGGSDAGLLPGNPPGIPTQSGGNGIQGIMTALNNISTKLNSLPLDQIGRNVKTITARAADIATSGQLQQTLENLDKSVSNVQSLTASASREMPQIIAQLRSVATQADAAVRSARALLNNESGVTATGLQTAGLSQTLYQLSEAARAVRQLADYLDRHPSAFIRGRG
jgi:paraquat-inducible protein B